MTGGLPIVTPCSNCTLLHLAPSHPRKRVPRSQRSWYKTFVSLRAVAHIQHSSSTHDNTLPFPIPVYPEGPTIHRTGSNQRKFKLPARILILILIFFSSSHLLLKTLRYVLYAPLAFFSIRQGAILNLFIHSSQCFPILYCWYRTNLFLFLVSLLTMIIYLALFFSTDSSR